MTRVRIHEHYDNLYNWLMGQFPGQKTLPQVYIDWMQEQDTYDSHARVYPRVTHIHTLAINTRALNHSPPTPHTRWLTCFYALVHVQLCS